MHRQHDVPRGDRRLYIQFRQRLLPPDGLSLRLQDLHRSVPVDSPLLGGSGGASPAAKADGEGPARRGTSSGGLAMSIGCRSGIYMETKELRDVSKPAGDTFLRTDA